MPEVALNNYGSGGFRRRPIRLAAEARARKIGVWTPSDKMVSLVEQMVSAKKQLAGAQSDKDKDFYENKFISL